MAFLPWDEKYSINVKIDSQHKKLIDLINGLHDAMKVGKSKDVMSKILQGLIDYTDYHFSTEEKFMTKYSYPEYPQHKSEHERFVEKVLDFQKRFNAGSLTLSMEVLGFLKDWLSNHILVTDKKYGPFFNEKGFK
jgi:hemerythrin